MLLRVFRPFPLCFSCQCNRQYCLESWFSPALPTSLQAHLPFAYAFCSFCRSALSALGLVRLSCSALAGATVETLSLTSRRLRHPPPPPPRPPTTAAAARCSRRASHRRGRYRNPLRPLPQPSLPPAAATPPPAAPSPAAATTEKGGSLNPGRLFRRTHPNLPQTQPPRAAAAPNPAVGAVAHCRRRALQLPRPPPAQEWPPASDTRRSRHGRPTDDEAAPVTGATAVASSRGRFCHGHDHHPHPRRPPLPRARRPPAAAAKGARRAGGARRARPRACRVSLGTFEASAYSRYTKNLALRRDQ